MGELADWARSDAARSSATRAVLAVLDIGTLYSS
jgi:hypothetical protein